MKLKCHKISCTLFSIKAKFLRQEHLLPTPGFLLRYLVDTKKHLFVQNKEFNAKLVQFPNGEISLVLIFFSFGMVFEHQTK